MNKRSSSGVVREVLPSGLRVIAEPLNDFSSVSVGVWVLTGSRDESPSKTGISHLIEHLAFKGTPSRSARQIALEVDSLGGSLNAFTSKEFTSFHARVLGEALPQAMEILGDVTLQSVFRQSDLEKEREVVIQEIMMVEDAPEDLIHELHNREFFSGHSLGWPILGTQDSLKGMERQDVLSYHRERYRSESIILTAAGALNPHRLIEEIETSFGGLHAGSCEFTRTSPCPSPGVHLVSRPLEQVHFCVGYEGIRVSHEDRYALYLLNTILGGGMSSRLFQSIREERGLAYSVYSYHSVYEDAGLLTIYCGPGPEGFAESLELIRNEVDDLSTSPVTDEELATAKRQLKGNLLLGLESTANRMNQLARNEIYFGRQIPPLEIEEGIDSVAADEIRDLAARLFTPGRQALTVIGPVDEAAVDSFRD